MLAEISDNHTVFFLKGVSGEVFKQIVIFIYLGEVNIPWPILKDFLMTAKDLQLKGLESLNSISVNKENIERVDDNETKKGTVDVGDGKSPYLTEENAKEINRSDNSKLENNTATSIPESNLDTDSIQSSITSSGLT